MTDAILPGATLGVLGSGQLGRMFAIAARRMGYRVHVLSPDDDTPTGQVADLEIAADYEDFDAVAQFAQSVSVVSFEFENVSSASIEVVQQYVPVRPGARVLHTTQNRTREKNFLREAGLPVTDFHVLRNPADVARIADQTLAFPAVLKTSAWGYDGKGQVVVRQPDQLAQAWEDLDADEAVLEKFVDFQLELSVVGARGLDGSFVAYPPIVNAHANHILDVSICPGPLDPQVARQAVEIAREVFERLDVVGVLCVEFFLGPQNELLINELAPRPHNSGHLTIDAHVTCQFEQQVRAVCGLPLGSTHQHRPAAMANLLGDLWQKSPPNWEAACQDPELKLHLYGKREPRIGRKMGHLTALGADVAQAEAAVRHARNRLLEPRP